MVSPIPRAVVLSDNIRAPCAEAGDARETAQRMKATSTIRILIADDHAIVRAGLAQFISDQPDMRVEAEAAS